MTKSNRELLKLAVGVVILIVNGDLRAAVAISLSTKDLIRCAVDETCGQNFVKEKLDLAVLAGCRWGPDWPVHGASPYTNRQSYRNDRLVGLGVPSEHHGCVH